MRNGILIVSNQQDVSDNLVWNSLSKNEALNNNKNTCSFSLYDKKLTENDDVYIYDYVINIQPINIGEDFFYANDTYQIEEKYKVGDYIYMDILGENTKKQISAVDPVTNKITLTETFTQSIPVKSFHGSLFFAGVIDNIEEKIISKSSTEKEYSISLVGFEKILDRKVVIDTYISQYTREIIGRILYKFVANDSEIQIFDFESNMIGSGLCTNTTNYSTDTIYGTYCQKATASGNGMREKTITSIDISSYKSLGYRWKMKIGMGDVISNLSLRIGTDSSNYFKFENLHLGGDREDCWLYENVELRYPTDIVGNPDLNSITWIAYNYEGGAIDYILFDIAFAFSGGIRIGESKRGTKKFEDVRFKGKSPSVCIENITKTLGHFWYVDYDRSFHYYYQDGEGDSSFRITDTDKKYSSLEINIDTKQIVNRQLVEGSEAPAETLYTQEKKADGVENSFSLDFKPAGERKYPDGTVKQGLKVFVNNVEKTIGLEGLVNESLYDFVYNFSDKVSRNASFPVLADTDIIKFTYYPYKTISVRYVNNKSVSIMKALLGGDGIFDGQIIIDKSIEDIQIARQRAIIEVETKKDPIVSYSFTTDVAGIKLGQNIYVVDITRGINNKFQVQKISAKSRAGNMFEYKVDITTKFFDYVEFFQLLLKKSANFQINQNAEIIIPINDDEEINIQENYITKVTPLPYQAGSKYIKFIGFDSLVGSISSDGYIGSRSSGVAFMKGAISSGGASFQSISGLNVENILNLDSTTSASGDYCLVRTIEGHIHPNTTIKFVSHIRVNSVGAGAGAMNIYFREYDSSRNIVATTIKNIPSNVSDYADFILELTTNNNTRTYEIDVEISELVANIDLLGFYIQDKSTETSMNPGIANFSFAS